MRSYLLYGQLLPFVFALPPIVALANPMSERTRGFELPRKNWNENPTPRAIFPCNLISTVAPIGLRSSVPQPVSLWLVAMELLPLPEAKSFVLQQYKICLHDNFKP